MNLQCKQTEQSYYMNLPEVEKLLTSISIIHVHVSCNDDVTRVAMSKLHRLLIALCYSLVLIFISGETRWYTFVE